MHIKIRLKQVKYLELICVIFLVVISPIAIASWTGRIKNEGPIWAYGTNFYGALSTSKGMVKENYDGVTIGGFDNDNSSSVTYTITVFQYPFMTKSLFEKMEMNLYLKEDTPKTTSPSWELSNHVAAHGYDFSIFPSTPGYSVSAGKYFSHDTKGYLQSLSVYTMNKDSREHDIHFSFTTSPGGSIIFNKTLSLPPRFGEPLNGGDWGAWIGLEIEEYWDVDSIFVIYNMEPLENMSPRTYPVKVGWSYVSDTRDTYFLVFDDSPWELSESTNTMIRLALSKTARMSQIKIILNGENIMTGELKIREGNYSMLSSEEFNLNYNYYSTLDTINIPINNNLLQLENSLTILVDPYVSWNISYVNLSLFSTYGINDPFWMHVLPVPVIYISTIGVMLLFSKYTIKLWKWANSKNVDV